MQWLHLAARRRWSVGTGGQAIGWWPCHGSSGRIERTQPNLEGCRRLDLFSPSTLTSSTPSPPAGEDSTMQRSGRDGWCGGCIARLVVGGGGGAREVKPHATRKEVYWYREFFSTSRDVVYSHVVRRGMGRGIPTPSGIQTA